MWIWPQALLGSPSAPLPHTSPGRPFLEHCKKNQGGGGKREGEGGDWGGKGCSLREGSSSCNGGWGGPSEGQLGPDPHLGALDRMPSAVAIQTQSAHILNFT